MLYQEKMQQNEKPNEQMLSCFVYKDYYPNFDYHWHTYFEVFYIIENMTMITLNGKTHVCKKGDLVFIPAMMLHSISCANDKPSENLVLQFNKDLLEQGLAGLVKINSIRPGEKILNDFAINIKPNSELGKAFLQLKYLCEENPNGSALIDNDTMDKNKIMSQSLQVKGLTFLIISLMIEDGLIDCSDSVEKSYDLDKILQFESVLSRLSENVEDKLRMDEAAKMAGMSYHSFSRAFHQVVGMNFKEYQNKLCIWRAEELLANTDKSILEISETVNFMTLRYFNEIFKKYNGNTPSEYRKKTKLKK